MYLKFIYLIDNEVFAFFFSVQLIYNSKHYIICFSISIKVNKNKPKRKIKNPRIYKHINIYFKWRRFTHVYKD